MSADVLSDVLKTVRLTGAAFFEIVAHEPWAVGSPPRDIILPHILPGADHLIAYHAVTAGRCYGTLVGGQPIALDAGDVIIFTNADPHVMSSRPGMHAAPTTADVVDLAAAGQMPFRINCGEGTADGAKLVCGYLACDARPFNPLLGALPPVIKASEVRDGWLGQFIRFAVAEASHKRPGGETILTRMSELMFIDVVRRHLETFPAGKSGWLAGLRDPFIGKALSLLHAKPSHNWTLDDLAKQVGQSRTVLAQRFTELVGVPPMQYLARWRMQVASDLLSSGNAGLASIAVEIGYESEAAFSRAFKKMIGVPPATWRRRVQAP